MKIRYLTIGLVVLLASCVQYPTETRRVSDLRPTISFAHSELEGAARVILDGLDVGSVSDFTTGKNALKVLPGSHLLTIKLSEKILLEERFYVADGVHKDFSFR